MQVHGMGLGSGYGRGRSFGIESEEEKKNRVKLTKDLFFRIYSYLKPYRLRFSMALMTIVLVSALDVVPAILTGKIIDDGFIKGDLNALILFVGLAVAVLITSSLLGVLENYLNVWISQNIIKDMKNQLYSHLQQMAIRFFAVNKQGDIITRMTSDAEGVQGVITTTLTSTISNIVVLVASIVVMVNKSPVLALIGILILPLFILPTKFVGKKRWEITVATQEKRDEANQLLNETLSVSGQQLVKLFTNEKKEYDQYDGLNKSILILRIRENMVGRWFRMAISTFTNMGPMLIYLTGGLLILKFGVTELTVGDVTVMATLLTRMYRPVSALISVQVEFYRAVALFNRIFEYLDMEIEVKNKEGGLKPEKLRGNISFNHVSFSYQDEKMILKDVTFKMPEKSMTAIVGPSGSGKSTAINLLLRLYDVTGGAVKIDDVDVRDYDLRYLRENIGMVTQDSYLFNGTIRENLAYAKENATEEEMIKACKEANIYDFISRADDGFETLVGNRGLKLSGGEKQRLSIARVILKDPQIIIFDEATSSLDSIAEELIQDAIEPLLKGRTSLVVAHRLSTVMAADRIIVFEDGRIVEQGIHEDLLKDEGMYTKLYETQFKHLLPAPTRRLPPRV